jgi:GT2 family glycosyltransferase
VRYVENKTNLGFGGSNNKGAKVAKGDILIFLSNDVVVSGAFVEQIENIIDNYNGNVMIGNQVLYHDTGWNTITIKDKPSIVCYPVGYLLACTKILWNTIGGFDPLYGLYDYEDVDIGAWCIYNNVPMVALNHPSIRHLGEQTVRKVNPNREEHTRRNQILFREKWTEKLTEKYK